MKVKIKVSQVAYHRNGVSGAGFHVVSFVDLTWGTKNATNMIATVFGQGGHVAVLDVDGLADVSFGVNSHRGDIYEGVLRHAIADFEARPIDYSKPETILSPWPAAGKYRRYDSSKVA